MRLGLVIVGAVIAIIGGGLVLTLFFFSGGPTTTNQSSVSTQIASAQTWSEVFFRSTSSTPSIGLSWNSSGPTNVSLTPAGPCLHVTGLCLIGPAALNWTGSTNGQGSVSTANATAYLLKVTDPGAASIKFTAVVTFSYHPGAAIPTWAWGLIAAGSVTLLAIGGIAVFLGLFLPGGVYRESDPNDLEPRFGMPPESPPEDGGPPSR